MTDGLGWMPVRAFVSQSFEQLQVTLGYLERALMSGNLEEVRAAGVMTRMGKFKPDEVQLRYNQCRYELHLSVIQQIKGDPGYNPCQPISCQTGLENVGLTQLLCKFTNPWTEKGVRVHSRSSVGVFGYPLPAPLVPPEP